MRRVILAAVLGLSLALGVIWGTDPVDRAGVIWGNPPVANGGVVWSGNVGVVWGN